MSKEPKNHREKQELAEIFQVAHMYYNQNMLQAEIAKKLYLSRPTVSRMLAQARELGIVEIKVNPVIDRLPSLEKHLCQHYNLADAVVVTAYSERLELMETILAKFAAQYTSQLLKKGGILGISNDSSIDTVLDKMTFAPDVPVEIVQLMGTTAKSFSMQKTTLILNRRLKENPNLRFYPLSVPLYVNDLYMKKVLMQDANIQETIRKTQQCQVALTDVSSFENSINYHNSWNGQMGPHHISELKAAQAAGSICAQYYDRNGAKITSEWNSKLIALDLNDFAKIRTRIGIAVGKDKIAPADSALRGGLLNVLITDSNTAADLLNLSQN